MGSCKCCLTTGSKVMLGDADVANYTLSVSVDTTRDMIWEEGKGGECGTQRVYMYGPGKSNLQVTAYPFDPEGASYNLGLTCPTEVTAQMPWKYVFDCRQCVDCISLDGGAGGKVRGRWVGIPMKKRMVTVVGDPGSTFTFQGCASPAAKFNLQAGPTTATIIQPAKQYSDLIYTGLPIAVNTAEASKIWNVTVVPGGNCEFGIKNVPAYLTGFSFSYQPPEPPRVTYTFDVMVSYCPEC